MKKYLGILFLGLCTTMLYAQSVDYSTVSKNEILNLIGVWVEWRPNSNEYIGNISYKTLTWGKCKYVPNFSMIIDYSSTNSDNLVLQSTGYGVDILIYKLEKVSDKKYRFFLRLPDLPEFSLLPKESSFTIETINEREAIVDLRDTYVYGEYSKATNWFHLSGPLITDTNENYK